MTSIDEITRRDALTLTAETPIRRAVAQLVEQDVPAALVVDDSGSLIGILTQKDCFNPALTASYYNEWKGIVEDFMSRNVVSLPAATDIVSAAEAFQTHPHRVFPILDGEQLLGMLHRSDVLARLLKMG
ncbi:MAG TPA: CBS domain-containing protein [Maritimibacter sp.]|nr:CBS domain-containing protein [Maritimibacter sp.]